MQQYKYAYFLCIFGYFYESLNCEYTTITLTHLDVPVVPGLHHTQHLSHSPLALPSCSPGNISNNFSEDQSSTVP